MARSVHITAPPDWREALPHRSKVARGPVAIAPRPAGSQPLGNHLVPTAARSVRRARS